jgi:hypothetical protein
MYWKTPHDGQCCDCRPSVCDSCSTCPTADTIQLTLSGLAACCTTANKKITGLDSINGVHTLTRQSSGAYQLVLSGAVSIQTFSAANCATLFSTAGPYNVTILFTCDDSTAVLDIRLTSAGTRLFYEEIAPPASGSMFVFVGESACTSFIPYTYGGNATVD